ncbi:MAG TPA: hypothetical protein VNQ48_02310 [Microbacteriaceae bacterium]|nr:hypothetical protein [Microbacteriaceae bacterium]
MAWRAAEWSPVLEGDPAGLARCAATQRGAAGTVLAAAAELRGDSPATISHAVDALRLAQHRAAASLETLRALLLATAAILEDYAAALETAQGLAADADEQVRRIDTAREQGVERLETALRRRALLAGADPVTAAGLEQEAAEEQVRLARLDRQRLDAVAQHERAAHDRDVAAEAAATRFAALGTSPDAAQLARPSEAADAVHPAPAGTWLRTVLDLRERAVEHLFGSLWESLLSAGAFTVGGQAARVASRPFELAVLAAGAGVAAAFVRESIAADLRAPTPTVRPVRAPASATPRTVAEAFVEAAEVDALGRDARTVVKITQLHGSDGTTRWRVVLPSTQEWVSLGGDRGATNDLDANLALLLAPEHRTQVERGVFEAMRQAGIAPEDPVLLVGFSQGGIMSAHLAAHRDEQHWAGVIAAGAPIDAMPIRPGVPVVSVEHFGDPVPRLEPGLAPDRAARDNWTTIRAASSATSDGLVGIHSAVEYDATLRRHGGDVASQHPQLQAFFAADERTRTRYYAWQE